MNFPLTSPAMHRMSARVSINLIGYSMLNDLGKCGKL